MASFTPRKNKQGKIISYQIKVSRGRDTLTGKQLTPYTMTFTPPEGWSKKAVERELFRVMGEFEAACNRGEILTKEEEKQRAAAEMEQAKRQAEEERQKPTFSRYIETFLNEKSISLSRGTITAYKLELEKASEFFGGMKMADIDFLTIKGYFTDLQTNGKHKYTGKALKHSSIIQHYTVLHSFFENAVENEVIDISPMQKMKRPKARKNEIKAAPIAYDESTVKYIIECLNKEPLKWKALVMFAIDSGCRAGEIVGLKWSEVDFKTGKVNICRNLQYTPDKGVFINTPKSRKNREIYINSNVLKVLYEWKKEQTEIFFGLGIKLNGFCFTRDNGELMPPAAFGSYLRTFGKRYDLPGIHPHALRHTMATISIANGADIVSVSKKLGHANTDITLNVYSHANEEAQRRANDILANALYKEDEPTDTSEENENRKHA